MPSALPRAEWQEPHEKSLGAVAAGGGRWRAGRLAGAQEQGRSLRNR